MFRAHIGLEKAARVLYNKLGFFLDLLDDPLIGILSVEPSCADFDQAFPAVSQKCGQAKLPHKNDPRAAWIIEQNRGTIAGIINLRLWRRPSKRLRVTLNFSNNPLPREISRRPRIRMLPSSRQYPNCSRKIRSSKE